MTSRAQEPVPTVVGSERIYEGRVIKVRVDELETDSGLRMRRDVVEHPGAAVIVSMDAAGLIYWVRQYRHATGQTLLELPAGTLESGEDPEACARRELAEETGFAAAEWQPLGGFFTAPGFCSEYIHAFAATSLSPESADGDEDEDIEVVPLSLEDSLRAIDAGGVIDAKSIAALHLYLRKR